MLISKTHNEYAGPECNSKRLGGGTEPASGILEKRELTGTKKLPRRKNCAFPYFSTYPHAPARSGRSMWGLSLYNPNSRPLKGRVSTAAPQDKVTELQAALSRRKYRLI